MNETTDYSGMFVYKDDHLDYILTSEGRMKWDDHDSFFHPEYFIKDHLGKARTVLTIDPNRAFIAQQSDYYPFGLEIPLSGTSDNQLKYNGKFIDPETGLYYYGARYYDPHSSTWLSVDPLAEKYAGWTPYNYCANNPIILTDKDGNKIWIADPNGGKPVLYTPNNTSQQDGVNSYIKTTSQALDYLINNGLDVKGVINTLASDSDNEIKIQDANWDSHANQLAGLISWSPEGGIITDEGGRQSPVIGLLHEVGEAYFDIYKPTELSRAVPQLTDFSSLEEFEVALDEYEAKCKIEAGDFQTINDKWVIQEVENPAAALKGDAVRYSHHYPAKYQAKNFISLENE